MRSQPVTARPQPVAAQRLDDDGLSAFLNRGKKDKDSDSERTVLPIKREKLDP